MTCARDIWICQYVIMIDCANRTRGPAIPTIEPECLSKYETIKSAGDKYISGIISQGLTIEVPNA